QAARAGGPDRLHEVVRGLLAHAIEFQDLRPLEAEDVREMLHQAGGDELVDELLAHAVDVHLAAAGEPDELLAELCGALGVHAEEPRALALHGAAAGRAAPRRLHGTLLARTQLGLDTQHLGDDFAGLLDHDVVADADVLALDLL